MSYNIIEVKNLNKVFKVPKKSKEISKLKRKLSWFYREWEEKVAVKDINLEIKKGEILGYLVKNLNLDRNWLYRRLNSDLDSTMINFETSFICSKDKIYVDLNNLLAELKYNLRS